MRNGYYNNIHTFSRENRASGLATFSPLKPNIGFDSAAAAKLLQSCLTLCDPMDCSLPGSSIHGIFQARVLEWGAIAKRPSLGVK